MPDAPNAPNAPDRLTPAHAPEPPVVPTGDDLNPGVKTHSLKNATAMAGELVFLSYGREDRLLAESVEAALTNDGLEVWWDPKISAGDDFDRAIEAALFEAACVVVLWTEHSIGSRWVRSEARAALERGMLLSVLVGRGVRAPLEFSGIQAVALDSVARHISPTDRHALVRAVRAMLTGATVDAVPHRSRNRARSIATAAVAVTLALALAVGSLVVRRQRGRIDTTIVSLGEQPYDVAVTRRATWVTDWVSGLLWRRDRTNGAAASIAITGALELARADDGTVAVSSSKELGLVRIVGDDGAVRRTIDTGATVDDMALSAERLWVSHHDAGTVEGIDVITGAHFWSTPLAGATSLAADATGLWATASRDGLGQLVLLDPATGAVMGRATAGVSPVGITTLDGEVWVADERKGTVDVYDGALHHLAAVPTGAGLVDLATDGRAVWASSSASSELVVIDPKHRRVASRRAMPGQPFKIDGLGQELATTIPRGGQVVLAHRR